MANLRIVDLPVADTPTGDELMPVYQEDDTRKLLLGTLVTSIVDLVTAALDAATLPIDPDVFNGITSEFTEGAMVELEAMIEGATAALENYTPTANLVDQLSTSFVSRDSGGRWKVGEHHTPGSAETIDLDVDGNYADVFLDSANCALTFQGGVDGQRCVIEVMVKQDGTGGRTISFTQSINWNGVGGAAPSLAAAVDAETRFWIMTDDECGTLYGFYDLSAAAATGEVPVTIRKTSDESVTSSTTLQNDNELKYTLAASEQVTFRITIFYEGDSAGDLKVGMTAPSGATGLCGGRGTNASSTGSTGQVVQSAFAFGTGSASYGAIGTGSSNWLIATIDGVCINGATPGDLQFQWAQLASSATATKVLTNSYMVVSPLVAP